MEEIEKSDRGEDGGKRRTSQQACIGEMAIVLDDDRTRPETDKDETDELEADENAQDGVGTSFADPQPFALDGGFSQDSERLVQLVGRSNDADGEPGDDFAHVYRRLREIGEVKSNDHPPSQAFVVGLRSPMMQTKM